MDEPCSHSLCAKIGDGSCHFSPDGFFTNPTPEAVRVAKEHFGWPDDEMARTIAEATNNGQELVAFAREQAASNDPEASEWGKRALENLRRRGALTDIKN
jgi:hypothetical protein